jgi:Zn-dependent protease with chaperone function
MTVRALIFGPGLPPAGASGTLTISAIGVEVSAGGLTGRAPTSQVTLREVGFETAGLEVAWQDTDGMWAVHVLDPASANQLLTASTLSATEQAAKLRTASRKANAGRTIGRVVLAALLALPILLLVAFLVSASALAGWVADRVPIEQEISLGRQVFGSMRATLKLENEGPAYEAVRSIVTRLTANSRYRYEVHVVDDGTLNAFAMPGGVIVVHTGLIAATTRAEELAGVLAHEVQHVELRHSLRGLIKDMGLRGLWAFVTGDLGATIAGQAALELTTLRFSRDDEREADLRGLDALAAAGIDPAGMPAFFRIMGQQAGNGPPAFLSTHPLSEEREHQLRERLAMHSGRRFEPLPFVPWPPK